MAVHVFDNGVHYIIEPEPRPRRRVQKPAPPRTPVPPRTTSFEKEPVMSKDSTASANAEQASTKQEAPGGTKGEFAATWTLRRVAKTFLCFLLDFLGLAAMGFVYAQLILLIQPASILALIACLLPVVVFVHYYQMYVRPHIPKAADYISGKSASAWTKVKTWFKKSETTAAAAA